MPRTVSGVNDLQTLFPQIALQAHGWDPSIVSANSNEKLLWKCPRGHIYDSRPSSRTRIARGRRSQQGCPYCSGKRVLAGFNDLATTHPDVASEAHEWDPTTCTYGNKTKRNWKCPKGHVYESTCNTRTAREGCGCSICAGKKVLVGYNDLASRFPEVAQYAHVWDPREFTYGSRKVNEWMCIEDGSHIFSRSIKEQVKSKYKCPYCPAERVLRVLPGVNDLGTTFPEVAKEADGWDVRQYSAGSNEKKPWKCSLGHPFEQTIVNRTMQSQGCPYCSGRYVWKGFNDLQTRFPDVAKEAEGWDPSEVNWGSAEKRAWKCPEGHIYEASINQRTWSKNGIFSGTGCNICSGREVLAGFNDLLTYYPKVAAEANGWDPSAITKGSAQKMSWKCPKGHIYEATVANRTGNESGCPVCAEYGFNPEKDAWVYLMERPGEQQFGITNVPDLRTRQHAANGWMPLDWYGPALGRTALDVETDLKRWIRATHGTVEGTRENWSSSDLDVQSLKALCDLAEVDLRGMTQDLALLRSRDQQPGFEGD